jgi:hypothetical protein
LPTVPEERPPDATSLVASLSAEYAANIAPDGRYFAYQSAESGGRFAIYVQPYPEVSKGRWQISTEGGKAPVWAPMGRELFYLDESYTLMAVPVRQPADNSQSADRPRCSTRVMDAGS